MYKINQTEIDSENSLKLHSLFLTEWPSIGSFESIRNGVDIPNPLVASLASEVIGGASFTSDKSPIDNSIAIWLNALYVRPEYRNKKIASSLIQESKIFSKYIYALTDIPALYIKNGWSVVAKTDKGAIVRQ